MGGCYALIDRIERDPTGVVMRCAKVNHEDSSFVIRPHTCKERVSLKDLIARL